MLKINSLTFNYAPDVPLIDDLDFHLQKGENLTILGSNGSGKSTLARLLCGLLPSQKTIQLSGRFIEDIPSQTRADLISYMPSTFSLFDPFVKVSDYLSLSLYPHTCSSQQQKEILSYLGLQMYHDSYAKHLSSGEQQLLQLGTCMLQNALLTIFDEPTSNLDPQKTKRVYRILKETTYFTQKVLITHDLQLAYKLDFPILYLHERGIHYFENDFFNPANISRFFDDSIHIIDDNIVVTL